MNDNNELHSGIDIIEIDRIQNVLIKHPERFLRKIFTEYEINYCRGRATQLAARFASKEAAQYMSAPSPLGWQRLKRMGKYLLKHPILIQEFPFEKKTLVLPMYSRLVCEKQMVVLKNTILQSFVWGT